MLTVWVCYLSVLHYNQPSLVKDGDSFCTAMSRDATGCIFHQHSECTIFSITHILLICERWMNSPTLRMQDIYTNLLWFYCSVNITIINIIFAMMSTLKTSWYWMISSDQKLLRNESHAWCALLFFLQSPWYPSRCIIPRLAGKLDPCSIDNYRPIALLPVLSKLLTRSEMFLHDNQVKGNMAITCVLRLLQEKLDVQYIPYIESVSC